MIRQHSKCSGIVQGVGFRPFIYRLAQRFGLTGWVRNTPAGVELEVQGDPQNISAFHRAISVETPPLAALASIITENIPPLKDEDRFTIENSSNGRADIRIAADSFVCPDCLAELFNPTNQRYRHPFITCTNCGPRYSIITTIPYDRPNTTMAGFPLCAECRKEYDNPEDRRFHAQPVSCPHCGPQLRLTDCRGTTLAERDSALQIAAEALEIGKILAIKGIGGYHLAVDAAHHSAVQRLRERKKRDEKPFAVMVADLEAAQQIACISDMEARLLVSPERPIVIVRKCTTRRLSPLIAPGNGWLGLMLPTTPLQHLLLKGEHQKFSALVMTSGNQSDEPIAFQDQDALQRLGEIADLFLTHDRPIHIRSDDSVMRVFLGQPLFYRRARGYVPRAITLPFECQPLLATGAELKSAFCLTQGARVVISQHIGDLQNDAVNDFFCQSINHLRNLLQLEPRLVACDQHPDYHSSIYAHTCGLPLISVQHHHAHLAACMAENGLLDDVIGIIFDGTGFGSDATVWGGEFLVGGYDHVRRAAHLRPVPMPGGDAAVRQPWRMALAYLFQSGGSAALSVAHPVSKYLNDSEKTLFARMLERGINSPLTSSCGRLFDAVAALLNIRHTVSYDGQAAIELEALAEESDEIKEAYPFRITEHGMQPFQLDFTPCLHALLEDMFADRNRSEIARRFHATLAAAAVTSCQRISHESGLTQVVLSGGVFQNRLLTEMVYTGLTKAGLQVFTHRLVPPNDGCIALGQAAVAGWKTRKRG